MSSNIYGGEMKSKMTENINILLNVVWKDMVDKLATGLLLSINLSSSWVTNGLKGCIWTREGGGFTFYRLLL